MIPNDTASDFTVFQDVEYYEALTQLAGGEQVAQHRETEQPSAELGEYKAFRRLRHENRRLSKNCLDLYLPSNNRNCSREKQPATFNDSKADDSKVDGFIPPLVVFVHGGGWRRGDRQQWHHFISAYDTNLLFALIFRLTNLYRNIGETFAHNGIACAVISYPLKQPSIFITLFELFTSFVMSTFLSTTLLTLLMLTLHLLCSTWCIPFTNMYVINQIYVYVNQKSILFIPLCLLLSQLATWFCICFNITNYRHGHPNCIVLSTPLAILAFWMTPIIMDFDFSLWTISFLVTIFLQTSIAISQILYTHHNTRQITCRDQIKAVAKSVRWLKTFGQTTHKYDADNIVLLGHSAGSHLINMLVMDESYLKEVHLTRKDIKSVISLSGIHNLQSLNFGLTRPLYLSSFGKDPDIWDTLSPTKLITKNTEHMPEYLIISADRDYDFLKRDAKDYVKELHNCGYTVHFEIIPRTNHLSLPMHFGSSRGDDVLEQTCIWFVRKTIHKCQQTNTTNVNT